MTFFDNLRTRTKYKNTPIPNTNKPKYVFHRAKSDSRFDTSDLQDSPAATKDSLAVCNELSAFSLHCANVSVFLIIAWDRSICAIPESTIDCVGDLAPHPAKINTDKIATMILYIF